MSLTRKRYELSEKCKVRCRLLKIRRHMIDRCHKPKHPCYPYYGGRGIAVCARWLDSPQAFVDDLSPRPPGMTIERIDNDKGYSPDNVRWATRAEQVRNRRNNIHAVVNGQRLVLKDACALLGVHYDTIWNRVKRGMAIDDALSKPVQQRRKAALHV